MFLFYLLNKGLHLLSFNKTSSLVDDVQNAFQRRASLIWTLSRWSVLFNESHPLSNFQGGMEKQANKTLEAEHQKLRKWKELQMHKRMCICKRAHTGSPEYSLCCTLVDSQLPDMNAVWVEERTEAEILPLEKPSWYNQLLPSIQRTRRHAHRHTNPLCRGQPGLAGWEMAAFPKHDPDEMSGVESSRRQTQTEKLNHPADKTAYWAAQPRFPAAEPALAARRGQRQPVEATNQREAVWHFSRYIFKDHISPSLAI